MTRFGLVPQRERGSGVRNSWPWMADFESARAVIGPGNSKFGREQLRKRFYILFVTRGEDGQLRKIPIPVHYAYVFVAGAQIGVLGLTGIARSYMRMLLKTSQ